MRWIENQIFITGGLLSSPQVQTPIWKLEVGLQLYTHLQLSTLPNPRDSCKGTQFVLLERHTLSSSWCLCMTFYWRSTVQTPTNTRVNTGDEVSRKGGSFRDVSAGYGTSKTNWNHISRLSGFALLPSLRKMTFIASTWAHISTGLWKLADWNSWGQNLSFLPVLKQEQKSLIIRLYFLCFNPLLLPLLFLPRKN